MDPFSKVVLGAYLGGLGILGLWGGGLAWAQETALAGVAEATIAGAPLTLDLGNLTGPGAMVVCFWLLLRAEKLPAIRVRVYHYDADETTNHGARLRVPVED
jgi:hypothetical protein